MPSGQMFGPVNTSHDDLIAILTDMLERVQEGDSFEGSIEYMIPEDPSASIRSFDVRASYRVGNTMGQGGMRMIGKWVEAPAPSQAPFTTERTNELWHAQRKRTFRFLPRKSTPRGPVSK